MTSSDPLIRIAEKYLPEFKRGDMKNLPTLQQMFKGRLVVNAYGMMKRYGADRLRHYEPADLVSELFIDMLNQVPKWVTNCSSGRQFVAFVFNRLKQLFVNWMRKERSKINSLTEDLNNMLFDPFEAVYTEDDIRLAWKLVRAYRPLREREVGDMLIQGYTHEEIANQFGFEPAMVSTYVSRVRRWLRVGMGPEFVW